jgi:hypothetical protein
MTTAYSSSFEVAVLWVEHEGTVIEILPVFHTLRQVLTLREEHSRRRVFDRGSRCATHVTCLSHVVIAVDGALRWGLGSAIPDDYMLLSNADCSA